MNDATEQATFGERLKKYRLDRGWTQQRLAKYLGVSRVTITNIEAGRDIQDLTRAKIDRKLNGKVAA
jgi:transcriptional regulator with XRE-family HTH domain